MTAAAAPFDLFALAMCPCLSSAMDPNNLNSLAFRLMSWSLPKYSILMRLYRSMTLTANHLACALSRAIKLLWHTTNTFDLHDLFDVCLRYSGIKQKKHHQINFNLYKSVETFNLPKLAVVRRPNCPWRTPDEVRFVSLVHLLLNLHQWPYF